MPDRYYAIEATVALAVLIGIGINADRVAAYVLLFMGAD
jgi:hypothetical protein